MKFARDHIGWTEDDWKNVIWSDESFFYLFPKSNSSTDRIWASSASEIESGQSVKHSPKVMVWGMFSSCGVSNLHFVPPGVNVNSDYYREKILAEEGL